MELNSLSLRSDFASTGMNLSVKMAQAVALQDTTTTLLMCTHKQSFELITNFQEIFFSKRQRSKSIKVISIFIKEVNSIPYRPVQPVYTIPVSAPVQITPYFVPEKISAVPVVPAKFDYFGR